ncbi:patatin-like phospholipase family protein [Undibacterium baiyunense]|uniref:Patatin-like phospholipase family protein n=1 Tax=Undibacterium baiyunense TaxID=2828731 RepID=A0A941DCY5_9BURK|nr:patatin-like phospholipase family protein [Undibacterium baiyunense]MBR7746458.1 patatin-like phospholipase family protein [Undibacterium baiyunense]
MLFHQRLKKLSATLVFVSGMFVLTSAHAQVKPHLEENITSIKERPKVALVLSGGGARGFAHVGVLRVLKEMRIPIDFVVGTSMGAVVGGAYAAGRSVEEIEDIVRNTSWDTVLADRPARDALDFRRREEDVNLPSRIEFAVTKSGITFPPSAAGNSALEQALTRLLPNGMKSEHINHLPIPFRSVASDLVTGEMVELTDTPLFITLRASLAVPGMFAPVHINKRLVVDGGLVRNLPIDMAKKMGADIVIAVNVGTPLAQEKELGSAISVAQQMLQILTEQNVQRSLKELRPKDILIAPNLSGIDFLDFDEHHNAMLAGDIATRQLENRLQQLRATPEEYRRYEQLRTAESSSPDKALKIASIEIQGTQNINPDILLKQSGLQLNEVTSEEKIRQVTGKLYGRGDLDHVEVEIDDREDERDVVIKTHEAVWSKNRLRLGLELSSDFNDTHKFSLGAMHVAASQNKWGGEARIIAKIGSDRILGAQFFQPLGVGSEWFIAPSLQSNASSTDLFSEGRKLIRYGYKANSVILPIGRQIGNWGDIQLGVRRERVEVKKLLPEELGPDVRVFQTTEFLRYRVDTLDSLAYPTRGNYLTVEWDRALDRDGNKKAILNSSILGMTAFKRGEWAGHIYGEWSRSQGDIAPLSLGGFLRLSGTPAESLSNKTVALGRVVMAHRIGSMPAALGGAVRLGFSAELGGGFKENEAVKFSKIKRAVSSFVAFDTRFGPLYFGAGATQGSGSSFYLFLGPIW